MISHFRANAARDGRRGNQGKEGGGISADGNLDGSSHADGYLEGLLSPCRDGDRGAGEALSAHRRDRRPLTFVSSSRSAIVLSDPPAR